MIAEGKDVLEIRIVQHSRGRRPRVATLTVANQCGAFPNGAVAQNGDKLGEFEADLRRSEVLELRARQLKARERPQGLKLGPVLVRRSVGAPPAKLHRQAPSRHHGACAGENHQVCPGKPVPEPLFDRLEHRKCLRRARVGGVALLGFKAEERPVAPALVVGGAKRGRAQRSEARKSFSVLGRRSHGVLKVRSDQLEIGQVAVVGERERVLKRLRRGHVVSPAALVGAHVARHQFVPGVAKRVVEGAHVSLELVHQFLVLLVVDKAHVSREHHHVLRAFPKRGLCGELPLLWAPLPEPPGPLVLFPLVVQ
mmetsp:Transcript_37019/g.67708  ORF Transcript_37019/g.67708 Transcript_37019/m.67708 type:complete len:310 (-) Transcript_37019:963-1892(-)